MSKEIEATMPARYVIKCKSREGVELYYECFEEDGPTWAVTQKHAQVFGYAVLVTGESKNPAAHTTQALVNALLKAFVRVAAEGIGGRVVRLVPKKKEGKAA